jgi:hypothetical protein
VLLGIFRKFFRARGSRAVFGRIVAQEISDGVLAERRGLSKKSPTGRNSFQIL